MNNFVFNNPTKVIFGKNTILQIGEEIKRRGINKILILAGGGSIKTNGVYDKVIKSLSKYNIEYIEFWGVQANPILPHALEGIKLCKEHIVEGILAVGGGSVIDEAKGIGAGFYIDDLWSAYAGKIQVVDSLPIFSILTLSGTCSEMNGNSVLTNPDTEQKWFISGYNLSPKVSIIDPSIQSSLPWNQTVNGGIDAISHTLEFYILGGNEEISLSVNEAIINTVKKSLDTLQHNPNDYNSRASLAWAATIALNGISGAGLRGGDWATHRIEHGISAIRPDVAHGAGLAIIFPALIKYVYEYNKEHFNRFSKVLWQTEDFETAISRMKEKYKSWGAPISLSEIGIIEDQFPIIAQKSLELGPIGKLIDLSFDDVVNILKIAF